MAHGLALAVDLRGYAGWIVRLMNRLDRPSMHYDIGSGRWRLRKMGPYSGSGGLRAIGGFFAVVGAVAVLVGIFGNVA